MKRSLRQIGKYNKAMLWSSFDVYDLGDEFPFPIANSIILQSESNSSPLGSPAKHRGIVPVS